MAIDLGTSALDELGLALDDAGRGGHLPDPGRPLGLIDNPNSANSRSYVLALRSRLIALAYLPDSSMNRTGSAVDDEFRAAVEGFQRDAGLRVDAWAGPRTWEALQQLTSFEDQQDPRQWMEPLTDLSRPAVARAVYVRLYALGMFPWSDRLTEDTVLSLELNAGFREALAEFLARAHELGLTTSQLTPVIDLDTLTALFGQDELLRALDACPVLVRRTQNRRFVDSVSRIELWMLGFDVHMGNPRKTTHRRRKVLKLSLAVKAFWDQQPKPERPNSDAARRRVTPALFRRLVSLDDGEESEDEMVEGSIVARIASFTPKQRRQLTDTLEDIASSIWDGARRLYHWLRSFVTRVATAALNTIKNIARYLARQARTAFATVRKAVEILHRGIVYLRGEILPGSDARQIVIAHDRDFDMGVFVNLDADRQTVRSLVDVQQRESEVFDAACCILGHLAAILSLVARSLASGVAGWFLILLSLTRLARRFGGIAQEVRRVRDFELDSTMSPFANSVA